MFNFFVTAESREADAFIITGSDCNHIGNVLRMKKGEEILVSCDSVNYLCSIEDIQQDFVRALILQENYSTTEPDIKIYLFQGLPKGDKLELIIQKCVELGVYEIIPTQMSRCVVRLDEKKARTKLQRWQAISESAAKQSKRAIIPKVGPLLTFSQAIEKAGELDLFLIPYENEKGMEATREALREIRKGCSVGILIGSEGGFEEKEIEKALEAGGRSISLGKRILRTETAAMTSVGMCMLTRELSQGEEQ